MASVVIQREDSPFRHDAAGVLLHAPRPAQAHLRAAFLSHRAINVAFVLRMRGEDPRRINRQKPGSALAMLVFNQLVNRRGDARTPLGSKASLQILDAGKSCCSFARRVRGCANVNHAGARFDKGRVT